jgi:LPPG:FO 2-phospho-L-lactate transferase
MLVALAGGVGAARFLAGLVAVVPAAEVTVVVNTADDDVFHGLHVSPDLDSITYTLAGVANPETGWGLAGETFAAIEALRRYGPDVWFRLGDRDLATHLFRTQRLAEGATLSDVTREITSAWGLGCSLLPMTDAPVRTRITARTTNGVEELRMQEWFVRERTEPPVVSVRFDGATEAAPASGVLAAIAHAETVVVCPSNPVISIGPILAVPGVRDALVRRRDRVVAVTPIIGGKPVKGPADRLMAPLGIDVSCVGIAQAYRDFCSVLVIDEVDRERAPEVEERGVRAVVTDTLMRDARVAAALAQRTLAAV